MSRVPCRRPNLGDGMILVGAAALALTILRMVAHTPPPRTDTWYDRIPIFIEKRLLPCLIALSWAMMAIRLRRPRPPLRRVWRQPGAMASAMIVLTSILVASQVVARVNTIPRARYSNMFILGMWDTDTYVFLLFLDGSMLIAGAWAALALTRRMRCEPGWIDSLGTVLGATWIVAKQVFTTCMIVYRD